MSLRETLERIRSNPTPDNEETARFQILGPILADLSWDPFGQEVRWEHPVGGKKTGGKVDIAFQAEGRIWALIEAKAPGANLDHHVEQVLGYAFYEGVDICALSDGLQCPAAVRLWNERHPLRSHVEVLTTVVEELHRRHPHDFDQAVETLKAGEWQYVSRDRKRVYGRRIKQTAIGHFVNVNLSARNIRKRVVRLMETFGYRESDLEYIYE